MQGEKLRALFLAIVSASVFFVGCATAPEILIIVRDGSEKPELMLTEELGVMERLIEEAGLKYAVATAYEQTFWGPNATLEYDLLLEDVDVSKYAGVLLPCMSAGVPGTIEASSVEIVREAVAQGKPVAAQHGQICTLARAGLLTGKRYAYVHPSFREGVYAGTGVVQDGLILTSANCPDWALRTGEPDGTVELTLRLIAAIVR